MHRQVFAGAYASSVEADSRPETRPGVSVNCLSTPVLLLDPDYSGTLAAARELGRRGIPIWTAGASDGTPTAHSRFVTKHLYCPARSEAARLVDWLVDFGSLHPGTVLYPTSDDEAWL